MNSETLKNCPKCNAPIPADAPQGLCPRCVLAAASIATEAGPPANASPPPSLETVAAGFPQLEILEFIGQGGMGLVFKARQRKLDRFVALKLLPQKPGADPSFCERFNREARVLARLSHPNIVAVHDFGEAGPFFYLLMEYVDGVNLRQAMRAGRFTPAQALALVPKICDALQYAHEEGVLHRDIKPENLLLDTRGRVKIADFGIAKLMGEAKDITLTASGSAIGTPHYMAPEQLERPQDVDQRADVYSLGVVFYEMLTGELPIGRFAPPSEKAPVDPRLDQVVLKTLEKERERRFQSAGDVKTRVEEITASGAGGASGPTGTVKMAAEAAPPTPSVKQARRRRFMGAGALLVFIALLLILGRNAPPARGVVVVVIIGFIVFALLRFLKSSNLQSLLPNTRIRALLDRVPRNWFWILGAGIGVLLLMILLNPRPQRAEPTTVAPVAEPNAPPGFEVPPGATPGNERVYHSTVLVPPGYALTITAVLCSNQVVIRPGQVPASATLQVPAGQPVQGVLSWRLLANSTFADGAPLRLSLGLGGPDGGGKSFNVTPPEPVTIDWVADPPSLWPPENGHTKKLLVKGTSANAAAGEGPAEWAVGIEERVDPIPETMLRELKGPVITLGTNGLPTLEELSASPAGSAQ